jgi:hypothetical protein
MKKKSDISVLDAVRIEYEAMNKTLPKRILWLTLLISNEL